MLHESRDGADIVGLPDVSPALGRWVVLTFDAEETRRVPAMRERLMAGRATAAKAGVPQGTSKMDIGTSPTFWRTGATVSPSDTMAVAMYWAVDKGFVMVLRDTALDDLLKDIDDPKDLPSLPPC